MSELTDLFGDVIYAYTRKQAIEDGTLVDVSETATEAGFKVPVALTHAAWNKYVLWRNEEEEVYQDESGRLWDVLWMAINGIRQAPPGGHELLFKFLSVPSMENGVAETEAQEATLKLFSGPGDEGEHVITIMLPDED